MELYGINFKNFCVVAATFVTRSALISVANLAVIILPFYFQSLGIDLCLGIGIPLLIYNIFKSFLLFKLILLIRQEEKAEFSAKKYSRQLSIPQPNFHVTYDAGTENGVNIIPNNSNYPVNYSNYPMNYPTNYSLNYSNQQQQQLPSQYYNTNSYYVNSTNQNQYI